MKLLVIRHAQAMDRSEALRMNLSESERPLTKRGIKAFSDSVESLYKINPKIDLILTSPLKRAHDTALLLQKKYKHAKLDVYQSLSAGKSLSTVLRRIFSDVENLAIVGHEPQLSRLISFLISGQKESFIELKKGAVCLIEIQGSFSKFKAELKWLITPKIMTT
ncbi:MAG: histidine phosphatase family protein [Pseudomonadota bacterium]|nr:histidine phosphatase family protein [Pseudomonadota bacterium]